MINGGGGRRRRRKRGEIRERNRGFNYGLVEGVSAQFGFAVVLMKNEKQNEKQNEMVTWRKMIGL